MVSASHGLHLTQPQPLLVFTARGYGDFSSRCWNPGLGGSVYVWDPSLLQGRGEGTLQPRQPSWFLVTTHSCGTWLSHIFASPAGSRWPLVFVPSCRATAQPDLRRLLTMVALEFCYDSGDVQPSTPSWPFLRKGSFLKSNSFFRRLTHGLKKW